MCPHSAQQGQAYQKQSKCSLRACVGGGCAPEQEQAFTDVEMPGQHLAGAEIAPEALVYLERVGANVGIVRRHATSYRRLAFHGSDGKVVHFLVQTGQHWSNTSGARRAPPDCSMMVSILPSCPLLHASPVPAAIT
jgi:hypothetical protein